MFWGCFNGITKGPCVFWEKNWGHITMKSYIEHIIPVLDDWLKQHPGLCFMQDGAPGHRGGKTQAEIQHHNMPKIPWPPYSPDLNPIETMWDKMKDYLQDNFPERMTYPQLRAAVQEAWDSITVDRLNELIDSMHDRCQAVIDANGMQTPY
jgi:transposase